MKAHFVPARLSHLAASAGVLLLAVLQADVAHAWSLNLSPATRRVFLHVGNGTANQDNSTVNLVQVSVPAAQVGNGVAQAMASNSTQSTSLYGDGYTTCPTPSTQVMVGASYQRNNNSSPASATLRVTSPASLVSAAGDTIPFSQISWTVSAAGSPVPGVIPAGTFSGTAQTLATVPANTYIENCHTFSYANSALRAAGTYTGQVTYTLTSP